jgi:hypothetical protein
MEIIIYGRKIFLKSRAVATAPKYNEIAII